MDRTEERRAAVAQTVARIRALEAEGGVTRDTIEAMKDALLDLAAQKTLFSQEDFALPSGEGEDTSRMYCLSEDADHRFALYLQSCLPGLDVPPHNHTTWAVIVGMEGVEENRFYERDSDGPPTQKGNLDVGAGVGTAFLPDELHSIHIHGDQATVNFHMYGLALTELYERTYWSRKHEEWRVFPPQEGIIDRRQG